MGRYSTSPLLFDQVLQLNISNFKKWGYLDTSKVSKGTITWTSRHSKSEISIYVNMPLRFVELDYRVDGKPISYKVNFVTQKSNLGKGEIFYFLCPITFKRCRILYLLNGYFSHRTASSGMYECQTQSKYSRLLSQYFSKGFELDKHYDELYSPYFKTHYKGKPTKRYLRLMKKIEL